MAAEWTTLINGLDTMPQFKLLDKLTRDDDTSTEEALRDLVKITLEVHSDQGNMGNFLYYTCRCFLVVGARTEAAQQSKLVDLVLKLSKETVLDPSTGEPITYDKDYDMKQVVWKGFPAWGYTITDEYQFDQDITKPSEHKTWENLSSLLGQIMNAAHFEYGTGDVEHEFDLPPTLDRVTAALWTIKEALEDRDGSEGVAMRAACLWFIHVSDRLWFTCVHRRMHEAYQPFSIERWNRWEQRLREARAECNDERTQALMDDALFHMNRVKDRT